MSSHGLYWGQLFYFRTVDPLRVIDYLKHFFWPYWINQKVLSPARFKLDFLSFLWKMVVFDGNLSWYLVQTFFTLLPSSCCSSYHVQLQHYIKFFYKLLCSYPISSLANNNSKNAFCIQAIILSKTFKTFSSNNPLKHDLFFTIRLFWVFSILIFRSLGKQNSSFEEAPVTFAWNCSCLASPVLLLASVF